MPVDPVYHGTNWFVDPENLQLYRMVGEQITPDATDLYTLTSGQLTISGGMIRQVGTGRIVQPLYADRPAQLSVMPTGQLLFQRETSADTVGAMTSSTSRYSAGGEYRLTLPSGVEQTYQVQPWMTGQGQRLLISSEIAPGMPQRYMHVAVFDAQGNQIEPLIPAGYRYASPAEVMDRALTRMIIEKYSTELKEMVDAGMFDENGAPITSVYDAAGYISSQIETTPYLTSILLP